MLNTPDATEAATPHFIQSVEKTGHAEQRSDSPTKIICDLADVNAFCESYGKPHVPVMSAFGAGRLHVCRMAGSWDLERATLENAHILFRSIRNFPGKSDNNTLPYWDDLTFQFGPQAFLYADADRIIGFASSPMEAERLVTQFSVAYAKPSPPIGGGFNLLQIEGNDVNCHKVSLPATTILSPESLTLHYGCMEWHQEFTGKLKAKPHGLSIFEGRPGTGKTFYLRHLMWELKDSHRFYFIPSQTMKVLVRPEFISFWADQRRQYSTQQFVVILEDADAALMTRGSDNREQVSAILNLSDGMLADFLKLQIICTINCSASDIDPALLRPGRLLCHRVFNKLDYAQASRLAERIGRKLPMASDYSLAEIFSGPSELEISRPQIGFGK